MSDGFLSNQFLIAMPGMADPNFSQTVTLSASTDLKARSAL